SSQDLYLQITAPSDSGWAGVGLGTRMRGATIFVIYPNAANTNLTLSPRTGEGNIEPQHDSSIDATVLGGTEIKDGKWIMNFVCHNCRGAVDVTSTDADFIYAQGGSDSISSDQPDASIYQHGTRGQFSMDLVAVTKTTSGNPFLSTNTGNTGGNNTDTDNSTSNDSGEGDSSAPMSKPDKTLLAHGIIMAVSWLFLLPLGATFIRFLAQTFPRPVPLYMHAGIQLLTFILAIVGFSLGIYTSEQNGTHWTADHQKLGVAIMVLFFLQAPMGYIHHVNYVATGKRQLWSHAHIWNGRLVMLLGIVNGGLGLDLAGIKRKSFGGKVDKKWVIAYSVVAGIVGSLYIGGLVGKALIGETRERRGNKEESHESRDGYQKETLMQTDA
ncbi:hypothetical protein EV426DRAFT_529278, partial [Tirmania nivea]